MAIYTVPSPSRHCLLEFLSFLGYGGHPFFIFSTVLFFFFPPSLRKAILLQLTYIPFFSTKVFEVVYKNCHAVVTKKNKKIRTKQERNMTSIHISLLDKASFEKNRIVLWLTNDFTQIKLDESLNVGIFQRWAVERVWALESCLSSNHSTYLLAF